MRRRCVLALTHARRPSRVGGKAAHLRFLSEKGFSTPRAFVCTTDAYARYRDHDQTLLPQLRSELQDIIDTSRTYAVRSSATVEDARSMSFAGQFATLLSRQGVDDILTATQSVWASAHSSAATTYQAREPGSDGDIAMAVIVQEMVEPVVSGVAFSRNPLTGMDEVIVEGIRGGGEALAQRGVTPERWVDKWGDWLSRPTVSALPEPIIQQVVQGTREIARAFGAPADLEWVYDGQKIHWIQLRPITSLEHARVYSDRVLKEMLPGVIKPLVWSINVPLFSELKASLLGELVGRDKLDADSLVKPFYYRAYANMSLIGEELKLLGLPSDAIELMLGIQSEGRARPRFKPSLRTWLLVPRMVAFALRRWHQASRLAKTISALASRLEAFESAQPSDQSEREDLEHIRKLRDLMADIGYCNLLAQILMHLSFGLLRSRLGRLGLELDAVDLGTSDKEPDVYDLNAYLASLRRQFLDLSEAARSQAACGNYLELVHMRGAEAFLNEFAAFMQRFGHMSDSTNDFSAKPWRESPEELLRMIATFTPRQSGSSTKIKLGDLSIGPLHRQYVVWLGNRAAVSAHYRDAISYQSTSANGSLRHHFMSLAAKLVRRGVLDCADDIFYLYLDELSAIVERGHTDYKPAELVRRRRQELESLRNAVPPSTIFGDTPPPLQTTVGRRLVGTPTSGGHYQGRVAVARGLQDFGMVKPGAVLVIPHSDVSWTPLFAKVGAVVSESGGMLSHSSIVAREYRIPAVVSVPGACALPDGCLVTVDGYAGEIIVNEREDQEWSA